MWVADLVTMLHRPVLFSSFIVSAMVAGLLPSCDRSDDPGLVEKVSLLEAELRNRDQQIAALEEGSKSAGGSSSGEATASAPDLDAARAAYLGFVETLKGKLAEVMPDAKFDRTSVFPVEGPDPSAPIFSRVAFRIITKDGRSGEMVVPLSASPSGTWNEPATKEIAASFKSKLAAPPVAAATAPTSQAAPPPRSQPTDVMGASRTVEVQWGDKPSQAGRNSASPPTPQPTPALAQPAPQSSPSVPKKVMPTSRDVIIDFE